MPQNIKVEKSTINRELLVKTATELIKLNQMELKSTPKILKESEIIMKQKRFSK